MSETEADFQRTVTEYLTLRGWRWTHFRPARTAKGWATALSGAPGFFDIVAARRGRLVMIELKSERGKWADEQRLWHLEICASSAEVYLWRPSDWPDVERILA